MKIIYKYIAGLSDSLVDYLNEHKLNYKIIRIIGSSRVIFCSFDDLNNIHDKRIVDCRLTEKYAIFSETECENAEWLSFSCSKCILSNDIIDKAFEFHEHTMIQVNNVVLNKEGYRYPVISPKNTGWLMFCNLEFRNFCRQYDRDLCFKRVLKNDGSINNSLLQIDSARRLDSHDFILNSADKENRATLHCYEDVKKIYVKNPGTYIPNIYASSLTGREIVSTDNIWGNGFGYRMFFCSHSFHEHVRNSKFYNYFSFKPVIISK